uniref:Uncharacterized protein n=1 Tax=Micrurus paraensis TaxID=1970185 RepID=A0A2D4KAR9_9SAUR
MLPTYVFLILQKASDILHSILRIGTPAILQIASHIPNALADLKRRCTALQKLLATLQGRDQGNQRRSGGGNRQVGELMYLCYKCSQPDELPSFDHVTVCVVILSS